jgi:methionyl-tRNA formyltransferase
MIKILFATTGDSYIRDALIQEYSLHLAGIFDFNKSNRIDGLEQMLKESQADLLVVYRCPFLLPEKIFLRPKFGSINIHPSLLPQYRGPNPWFWIYYNMEKTSGVTVHRIDKYEDHGDILAQVEFEIELGSSLCDLRLTAEKQITPLLLSVIANIATSKGVPQTVAASGISRACNVSDYSALLNPSKMDAPHVWHILRGFPDLLSKINPLFAPCKKYSVHEYRTVNNMSATRTGTAIKNKDETYTLFCRNGYVEIVDLLSSKQ